MHSERKRIRCPTLGNTDVVWNIQIPWFKIPTQQGLVPFMKKYTMKGVPRISYPWVILPLPFPLVSKHHRVRKQWCSKMSSLLKNHHWILWLSPWPNKANPTEYLFLFFVVITYIHSGVVGLGQCGVHCSVFVLLQSTVLAYSSI